MANIESIKQKILQLDAGSFQNLCDSYLYKTGYPSIVSLGGEAGTRKTTLGTPDTYLNTQLKGRTYLQKLVMILKNVLIQQRQVFRMTKSLKLFIVILHQTLHPFKIVK